MKTNRQRSGRRGSILVVVVIALLGASFLGAAFLSMATSSRFQRVHAASTYRAYYLAESGGAYVRSVRLMDHTAMPAGLFTLANGDQFSLVSFTHDQQLIVQSTGIANPGSQIEARRMLTFVLTDLENDVIPVDFDLENDGQFDDDMWNTVDVDPKIRTTGPSGGQPALDLKGTEGQIYLNWQDKPEVNLAQVWAYSGGLLDYDVQVKIKPFDTGSQAAYSKHYMLGISFRLHPDINNCYGLSYFRSNAGTNPGQTPSWVNELPPAFAALRGTNVYLVLWYRDGGIGTLDLLGHRLLTPADQVVEIRNDNPELKDYSTVLVSLKERYGDQGQRENVITAFMQGADIYPLWESRADMEWQDNSAVFPAPVQWEDGSTSKVDARLTSEDFDVNRPAEVGIHVFYDRSGANLKFFDDFALRMENYAASSTTQVQY